METDSLLAESLGADWTANAANDGGPSTPQAPFGGMEQSGLGREGGRYVMDEYVEVKFVSWKV